MHNTFLVETLALLRPEEMRELELFVQSEFHNNSNTRLEIIRLNGFMAAQHPDFKPEHLLHETVYEQVFPDGPIIANKLEKLFSELLKIVKGFMVWKEIHEEHYAFDQSLVWATVLRKRGAIEKFDTHLQKIEKSFIHGMPEASEHMLQKFQVETMRLNWLNHYNKAKDDININNTLFALVSYFEQVRIDLFNQLLLQQKLAHFDIDPDVQSILDLEHIIPFSRENRLLFLSKQVNQLLRTQIPNEQKIEELMLFLQNNEANIEKEALKRYFAYLRNFCTLLINEGTEHLTSYLFNLLKDNLKRGYLYYNDRLHVSTLMSLTKTAIATGHVNWAIKCIDDHEHSLFGDQDTKPYVQLNRALCYFEQAQYDTALDLLPAHFPNAVYHLMARRFEILCYYETKSPLLQHKMEAFKIFVWRASGKYLSEQLKEANKAFISSMMQLYALLPYDHKKKAQLAQKIREQKNVAESKWLLGKLG